MRKHHVVLLLLISIFLSGCGMFNKSVTVSVAKAYHNVEAKTYAILPFSDTRHNKFRNSGYKDAAKIMTDSFETAFLDTGYSIVERSKVNKVLKEMKFSHQGNVDEDQIKEIGKMTNSDVLIFGMVRAFQPPQYQNREKPEKATKCSKISFSVKAIHVQTGEIIWKGSITKSTGFGDDMFYSCEYDLLKYADKISFDLMEKIVSKFKTDKKSTS